MADALEPFAVWTSRWVCPVHFPCWRNSAPRLRRGG